jgi:hypothetical protein
MNSQLHQMSSLQLKQYLAEHRNDDEQFADALEELIKRDHEPIIYSKDLPLEEQETILINKIKEIQQK